MVAPTTFASLRALARFASIALAAGMLAGCGGHGNQPVAPGGEVANGSDSESTPAAATAHRIRLPLAHHNVRFRHAGPR